MKRKHNAMPERLLDYLPAIYLSEETAAGKTSFLGEFLQAFEAVLLGTDESGDGTEQQPRRGPRPKEGLAQEIERLHLLFNPHETPAEFLQWLAGWAAINLHAHLRPERMRELVARMIPLYRIRGTRSYLDQILELCLDVDTSVSEDDVPPLVLGTHSTVGVDTQIGGGPPHFFRVTLLASKLDGLQVQAQRELAYEVIELAKPAHTTYDFMVLYPHMQLGVHSTVGRDTVLGPTEAS
jgi:phage tail-like protein